MIRKVLVLGAAIAGLSAAPASAQDGGVVGGAVARLVGGGGDAEVVVERVTGFQPPRLAQPGWGNGSNTAVQYLEPAPVSPSRRVAAVSGGGEDMQVTYGAPAEAPAAAIAGSRDRASPRG